MRSFLRRHLHRLRKHLTWISLAVGLQALCRTFIPEAVLRGANDVGGNFLQTFGSMYGVLVAFAMFVVWQQHNDTQAAVEREATSLGEVYRLIASFTAWKERDTAREALRAYAVAVLAKHGPARSPSPPDRRLLLKIAHDAFLAYQPANAHEERLYPHTLDTFHELHEAREHRITVASLRLPDGLRWFVFIGAAVCVATICLLWVDDMFVQAFFTACMTWVVVAAASIVVDLDDPYNGDFIVDWTRFQATAKRLQEGAELTPPPT